ncbi:uncharacterized protein H6S33_009554 [Morchella sextelata]|uniref:uncharacterized protein n=1 Tax=Morchella sextelata TaxID=1174677 RepID=UPI001D03E890|nr:uncharacterized protein H6S33_009554 [Morchella sextelata]KAH0613174.1 hypothetical protein H6S33_009554 [Morchella sextelata]
MDIMDTKSASPMTANPTPSHKKKKANKKKKEQQDSGEQEGLSASRPNSPSPAEEAKDRDSELGDDDVEGEKKDGSEIANCAPCAPNGRENQHYLNGNKDDRSVKDDEDALRDNLAKGLRRTQELEGLVEALKKQLEEGSSPAEAKAQASEELQKERLKSQELEKAVQDLKTRLLEKSEPIVKSTEGLRGLGGESPAQREMDTAKLRQLLEREQEFREKDRLDAEQRLAKVQEEKQQLDTQYKALLGRVAHIRTTLSDKLKSDAEELERTRNMVDNLEEENRTLNQTINNLQAGLEKANEEGYDASKELSTLRSRLNLSQQNWIKERNDLISAEKYSREEYEAAKQAMQEWEIIATEERSVRESLGDRVIELEEQLANQQTAYDKVLSERDRESSTVDGLQRALQDIQNARKQELREVVETMEAQINQLASKGEVLEKRAKEAEAQLITAQRDLERVLPFEKEVKEKNLLIGKLRHEAVTLNDHLRKALRMLKRDNADDKIDKNLVTNVFLQFVSIQRGDSKKYEILQLIASVLDWNDEQREKAGLVRPGTAASSQSSFLKTPPLSPFHRSPSTPTLSDAYEGSRDIWASVLDSEKP